MPVNRVLLYVAPINPPGGERTFGIVRNRNLLIEQPFQGFSRVFRSFQEINFGLAPDNVRSNRPIEPIRNHSEPQVKLHRHHIPANLSELSAFFTSFHLQFS